MPQINIYIYIYKIKKNKCAIIASYNEMLKH